MRKYVFVFFAVYILMSGYSAFQNAAYSANLCMSSTLNPLSTAIAETTAELNADELPEAVFQSYYLPADDSVYQYLQNKSVKRFFNMWIEYFIDKDMEVTWDYNTLAPVKLLDHNFNSLTREKDALYTCMFSTEDGRCGYIIVSYNEEGPSISKWSLLETTPYFYDLRANDEEITKALLKTDIDLSTATAMRAEWIDTEKNRGDRIILFIDGKGNKYLCYLGDEKMSIEKQETGMKVY